MKYYAGFYVTDLAGNMGCNGIKFTHTGRFLVLILLI